MPPVLNGVQSVLAQHCPATYGRSLAVCERCSCKNVPLPSLWCMLRGNCKGCLSYPSIRMRKRASVLVHAGGQGMRAASTGRPSTKALGAGRPAAAAHCACPTAAPPSARHRPRGPQACRAARDQRPMAVEGLASGARPDGRGPAARGPDGARASRDGQATEPVAAWEGPEAGAAAGQGGAAVDAPVTWVEPGDGASAGAGGPAPRASTSAAVLAVASPAVAAGAAALFLLTAFDVFGGAAFGLGVDSLHLLPRFVDGPVHAWVRLALPCPCPNPGRGAPLVLTRCLGLVRGSLVVWRVLLGGPAWRAVSRPESADRGLSLVLNEHEWTA